MRNVSFGSQWWGIGGISDNDLKFKEELKITDADKYELIEEILSLSVFLQNNNSQSVFGPLINETKKSEWLTKLNSDLSLIPENEEVNNLLIIAFYLKFRYLIRNTPNLSSSDFQNQINHILKHAEKEASVALFLNGLFFGSQKFRELYYERNPLTFSKITTRPAEDIKVDLDKYTNTLEDKVNQEETLNRESLLSAKTYSEETAIVLSCFKEKDIIQLRELKDVIKEKTGNHLGSGFKELKQLLSYVPDIQIDEKASPQIVRKLKTHQTKILNLFSSQSKQ